MKKHLIHFFLLFWAAVPGLLGQDNTKLFPPKPEPAVYVHDFSGWLTGSQKYDLEQQLRAMHDTTSTQIVVMIRPDIGDYDRATYAVSLGNLWGIGQSRKDNGVVMLVVSEGSQRGIFISTGYGVEGALTDLASARISREMVPYFKDGRYYEGVQYGVSAVISAIHGEYDADPAQTSDGTGTAVIIVLCIIFGMIFLIAIFGKFSDQNMTSTGSFGSTRKSSGGGVFWGGGGSSGWGGGSSGGSGWGGGSFGGGSFGGGGGGASW